MYKNRSRGFTLIELLVVIAIIGILSAVVLASLSTARLKGNDAAIQSDLSTVGTEAAVYLSSNNSSYGTAQTPAAMTAPLVYSATGNSMFTADQVMVNAVNGAYGITGTGNVQYAIGVNGTTFAVYAKLTAGGSNPYICIDGNGTTKSYASAPSIGGGTAAAGCP